MHSRVVVGNACDTPAVHRNTAALPYRLRLQPSGGRIGGQRAGGESLHCKQLKCAHFV